MKHPNNTYALKNFFLFSFRHNDLPWNIRKFVHNKLETVNLTHNLKYVDPWAKSPWSHTDIGRMITGQIGCQVSHWIIILPAAADPYDTMLCIIHFLGFALFFSKTLFPRHIKIIRIIVFQCCCH